MNDSSPAVGATFTLSTTVQNDGDGDSPATTLRYFRSTDATITTDDTAEGSASVEELSPSVSTSASMQLTAPSTAGTYYYGACVDAVAGESDTTNNCSESIAVTIVSAFTGIRFSSELTNATQLEVGESIIFRVLATFGDGSSADVTAEMHECRREGEFTVLVACVGSLNSGRAPVDRVETGWRCDRMGPSASYRRWGC